MKLVRDLLLRSAVRVTGGRLAQRALQANVKIAHYLMGVGAGSSPKSSGEIAVLEFVREKLRREGTKLCAFDVGANCGQFLSALLSVIPEGHISVHAFEPGKTAFTNLEALHGRCLAVQLNRIGLSDGERASELFFDVTGSGMSSTLQRDVRHLGVTFSQREAITLTTFDAYLAARSIPKVDFLKMDVEGAELSVLKGAEQAFAAGRVRSVLFEFGGCNIDSRTYFRDFYYFFHRFAKARIFRVTPSGFLQPIDCYREQLEQFITTNFFVLLDESVDAG